MFDISGVEKSSMRSHLKTAEPIPFDATKEYTVARESLTLGSWTMDQIAARLASRDIFVTDFVYDEKAQDWIVILDWAEFKDRLKQNKPKSPPPRLDDKPSKAEAAHAPDPAVPSAPAAVRSIVDSSAEWFVQKGNHRFGPFTYLGVVRALQEKTVYEFDLVWKQGMAEWLRVAECADFKPECIRALRETAGAESGIFRSRQHVRVPFEREVIVHDHKDLWMGRSFECSIGGSGLLIENAALVPGQVVVLHFASAEGQPAFNAQCEIVSKQFKKQIRGEKTPVVYGVRFLRLDSGIEFQLRDYFSTLCESPSFALSSPRSACHNESSLGVAPEQSEAKRSA